MLLTGTSSTTGLMGTGLCSETFSSLEMFGVFWGEEVCEDDILSIKKSYLL